MNLLCIHLHFLDSFLKKGCVTLDIPTKKAETENNKNKNHMCANRKL